LDQYDLPLYQRSSIKWSIYLLFIFCSLFFAGFSILGFIFLMSDDLILGLLSGLLFLILTLYCVYFIISAGILKKFYIEMTSKYIRFKLPLKSIKTVYWNEIFNLQEYEYNHNTMISILLKKDVNKKTKRTISNNFNSMFGIPPYSFQFSLKLFNDIDNQKLLLTMGDQINRVYRKEDANIDRLNEQNEPNHDNIFIALIASIVSYIMISAIYGFTIYKFGENYLVIPILGCFIIISIFNKYYLENSLSLIIRFALGFTCFLQIPTAMIIVIIILEKINLSITNVLNVSYEYFNYIVRNPLGHILVIIAAISCFVIGGFFGRTKKGTTMSD